jgi:hypothetical protein
LSANDDENGEEAGPEEREAFARFLEVISTEDGRKRFVEDPIKALGDEHAKNLPQELRTFLESLDVEELHLLHRTCKRTSAAGLVSRHGNVTICHL